MVAMRPCNSAITGLGAGSLPRPAASSSVQREEAETERGDGGRAASKSPCAMRAKCCTQYGSSPQTSTEHSGKMHVCPSQNGKRRSSRTVPRVQPSRLQVCFLQNLCFLSAAVLGVGFLQPPAAQVSAHSVSTS